MDYPTVFSGFEAKALNRARPCSESFLKGSSLISEIKFCPYQFVLVAERYGLKFYPSTQSYYSRYFIYKVLLFIPLLFSLDFLSSIF